MRFRFNEFEFNNDTLLLLKNGSSVTIRHAEARVLSVLLKSINSVISKDDILSSAWQDRVVSEQVVFQNISHLRNMFGNSAIKTFPKRGYQWQLDTEVIDDPITIMDEYSIPPENVQTSSVTQQLLWPVALLFSFAFLAIVTMSSFEPLEQRNSGERKVGYIPLQVFSDSAPDAESRIKLNDTSNIDFQEILTHDTGQFEYAKGVEYPKLSTQYPFVLTGKMRAYNGLSYLDFTLTGPTSTWEGQLSATTKQDVLKQLEVHLATNVIYELISEPLSLDLTQAKLSIAHQAFPNDLVILRNLSITYLMKEELDKAMTMADKLIFLAQKQNNAQQVGRALVYQSKVLIQKGLHDSSKEKLNLALAQFEQTNDIKYQARAWYYQSWLDDEKKDYPAIKLSLLKSADLAAKAGNMQGEVEALIHLAVMTDVYAMGTEKYQYLQQAESIIDEFNFADYHLAKVFYRRAAFTDSFKEKERHLTKVLSLNEFTPEHWTAQRARRILVPHYIDQNKLDAARALVEGEIEDNSNNSYLKTLLAQASQQTHEAIRLAQRTFEQSELSGDNILSLDAALLLCSQQVNCDFYSQYINDKATAHWRNLNKTQLHSLNL